MTIKERGHRELPAARLGKSWIIDRPDLESWWNRRKERRH
jgi:hypothetical protein